MKNYKEINWHEINIDDVYEYYDALPSEEQFKFFKWLYLHCPDTDIDFLETFEDLRCRMPLEENIAETEEFVKWFAFMFPEKYDVSYEFIERDLCNYYLKNNDITKLRERIAFIMKNPVKGIDTITIRLYYQLIYHGLYQDAVDYAKAVFQDILDSEEIWGRPEAALMTGIYVDSLQKSYEKFKNTGIANFEDVYKLAEELEFVKHKQVFKIETNALLNPLNAASVLSKIQKNTENCIIELNVHFLKYMLDKYDIPFILSETFWSILSSKTLYEKSKYTEDCFYFDVISFENYLDEKFDYSFSSNDIEYFGKIWALRYIYEFLEENRLISAEAAAKMQENLLYHRNEIINYMTAELWLASFVFNWPENQHWTELKPLFENTYGKTFEEVNSMLDEFNEKNPLPKRIVDELDAAKLKENNYNPFTENVIAFGDKPYVKKDADTGRNETCPCGSGKKYKKCCMNK